MDRPRSCEQEGELNTAAPDEANWETNKEIIRDMYVGQDLPLSKVMQAMKLRGLIANKRAYKTRLKTWKMAKYATRQDWLFVARLFRKILVQGMPEEFACVQIHSRIRRMPDLRRYLRSHEEQEDTFMAEAQALPVPTPDYVRPCHPNGSSAAMIAHGCTQQSVEAYVSMDENLLPGPTPSEQPLVLPPSHQLCTPPPVNTASVLPSSSFGPTREFQVAELTCKWPRVTSGMMPRPSDNTSLEDASGLNPGSTRTTADAPGPLAVLEVNGQVGYLAGSEGMADFVNMSALSSFRRIPSGDTIEMHNHVYGSDIRRNLLADEFQTEAGPAAVVHPGPSVPGLSQHDAHDSYIAASMLACMYGAARQKDIMDRCLQQVSTAFWQMCCEGNPFVLLAASAVLTWLTVHAQGTVPERVMRASLDAAKEALGSEDPICVLLEWMSAAVALNKIGTCAIDSTRLRQIWQGFTRTLGEECNHAVVALYCLSLHLIIVDKDFALAERYLEGLYHVSAQSCGAHHIQTINILATLSRAQHRQKRHLAALMSIERSLEAAPLGLNHPHRLELLVRKAVILWRLNRLDESEELYWLVVRGRVATLGAHHPRTNKAHESLVDVLTVNGKWDEKKGEAHRLLAGPQVAVSEYESWWCRIVEANRPDANLDSSPLSDDEE